MMFRLLGTFLLPLCGWLTGDAFQQKTREHLRALEHCIQLLRRIRQEIDFRRADLALLYQQLRREGLLESAPETGTLQTLPAPGTLCPAEQQCFAECMAGLGRTEAEQECERLDYYIARFQAYRQQAEQTAQAQAGLPHRLGFAAGMVLAIFFL